jgi:hypothetical protein
MPPIAPDRTPPPAAPTDDDPHGWVDCTSFAAAMGVDATSRGAVRPSGHQIRDLSNEPVPTPGDPGLDIRQVKAALERFGSHWTDRSGRTFTAVTNDLKAHRWVLLAVWYDDLGPFKGQPNGAFGHAIGVMRIDATGTSALVFDPVRRAKDQPKWVPLATLRRAAVKWGGRTGLGPGQVRALASVAIIPMVP